MPTMYSVLYDEYIYIYINPFIERGKKYTYANSLGNLKHATFASLKKAETLSQIKKKVIESHC